MLFAEQFSAYDDEFGLEFTRSTRAAIVIVGAGTVTRVMVIKRFNAHFVSVEQIL